MLTSAWHHGFMSKKSTVTPAFIASGLTVNTKRTESYLDAYRRLQRTCEHKQRDPQGTCYHCGHREGK
jgi:hypothetical protein